MICLADGDPAGALIALKGVLDSTAPVAGYATLLEAHLLAGLAHRELDDNRAANRAAERTLELAEPDHLVLPFILAESLELLEALPRHETAHATTAPPRSGGPVSSGCCQASAASHVLRTQSRRLRGSRDEELSRMAPGGTRQGRSRNHISASADAPAEPS